MKNMKTGVIGLGNMGEGVARNFAKARVPLMVWDLSPAACKKFEGMKGVEVAKPGEMAEACDLIIFVVPSTKEVAGHLKGKQGILANGHPGSVICDFTTSDPAASMKLARLAARKGMPYLDAGMSGGATGAEAGTLTLMMGGDQKAFARIRKRLAPIASKLFLLGPSGSGHTLKLVHNLVTHSIFMATCEGCRMAERAGIRLQDVIDVFNVANARSYASQFRFPRHILSKRWDAKSRVYNLLKDLTMAVNMGRRLGADTSYGVVTRNFLEKAAGRGMLEKDYALLYRDFEKIRKSRARRKVKVS